MYNVHTSISKPGIRMPENFETNMTKLWELYQLFPDVSMNWNYVRSIYNNIHCFRYNILIENKFYSQFYKYLQVERGKKNMGWLGT